MGIAGLGASHMAQKRWICRRSFLSRVTGGAIAGGASLLVAGRARAAQASDSDPTDPIGHGRGGGASGVTDGDLGAHGDPVGHGRGGGSRPGAGGVSDSDSGVNADPAGHGRGGGSRPSTGGTSDSDSGPYADPAGQGRGGGAARPAQTDRGENCAQLQREQQALAETLGQYPYAWSEDDLRQARGDLGIAQARLARIDQDLGKTDGGVARDELIWNGGNEIYARIQRWVSEGELRGSGCSPNLPHACVDLFAQRISFAEGQQDQKRRMQLRLETLNEMIGNYCR